MSEATQNPMKPVFQMQRTMVESSQQATHDLMNAQKEAVAQMTESAEQYQSLSEQNADLSKKALHAYLDAVESMLPEGSVDFAEFEELLDEQYDALTENQARMMAAAVEAMEENADAFDQYVDSYTEVVDSSFDSFLEAHERIEANFEEAGEQFEDAAEELTA